MSLLKMIEFCNLIIANEANPLTKKEQVEKAKQMKAEHEQYLEDYRNVHSCKEILDTNNRKE